MNIKQTTPRVSIIGEFYLGGKKNASVSNYNSITTDYSILSSKSIWSLVYNFLKDSMWR